MQTTIEKPKLPSIQSMLEGITLSEPTATKTYSKHKRHASELFLNTTTNSAFKVVNNESIHGHLQPKPMEPKLQDSRSASNSPSPPPTSLLHDHIPSSTSPTNFYYPRIHHIQQQQQHIHRSPRNLHARSFSDYTHPYPSSSPPRTSGTQLAPLTFHRRAVSTNTLDTILQPLMHTPQLSLSTTTSTSSINTTIITTPTQQQQQETGYTSDESTHETKETTKVSIDGNNNKYTCPYCNKGFSRPSSLRIHTYSHTGERPFECPEQGCSRKFSVQSNMRRHLRVHRLGRPLKRNGGLISPADRAQLINKPLAARPINWVGVTVHHSSTTSL